LGMAVPGAGRASPSPVRPAIGHISGPAGRACSTAHVEIYTSSPVRRGPAVDGGEGASVVLCLYTYLYIHIYAQVPVVARGHGI
jgi:hypothetical protein